MKDLREKLIIPILVAVFAGFFAPFAPAIVSYFNAPHVEITYSDTNAPIIDEMHGYNVAIAPPVLAQFFKSTGYSSKITIIAIKVKNISDYTAKNVVMSVPGLIYAVAGGGDTGDKYKVIDLSEEKKIAVGSVDPGEVLSFWAVSSGGTFDYDYSPPLRATLDGSKLEPKLELRDEYGVIGAVAQNPGGFAFLFLIIGVLFIASIAIAIFVVVMRDNIEFHSKNTDAKTISRYQKIIDYVKENDTKKAQDAKLFNNTRTEDQS